MDRSPLDLDALAKIANDLFRDAPGPTGVPSAVQAAAPSVDQGLDVAAPHAFLRAGRR